MDSLVKRRVPPLWRCASMPLEWNTRVGSLIESYAEEGQGRPRTDSPHPRFTTQRQSITAHLLECPRPLMRSLPHFIADLVRPATSLDDILIVSAMSSSCIPGSAAMIASMSPMRLVDLDTLLGGWQRRITSLTDIPSSYSSGLGIPASAHAAASRGGDLRNPKAPSSRTPYGPVGSGST